MIVIPTADDLARVGGNATFFEANYPLFLITSTIISGPWNAQSDLVAFYHVFPRFHVWMMRSRCFRCWVRTSRPRSSSFKATRSIIITVRFRGALAIVGLRIAVNLGCLCSLLRGITQNSSPDCFRGEMTEEVLRLLELYVSLLPQTSSPDSEYFNGQMDQLLHRLVLHLRSDMFSRCVSVSHAQSAVHSAALLAVRAAAVLQSPSELSRSSLPSLRSQQGTSRPRHRPDPLLRHAARLRRPPRRRRNHRYFWNSGITPRKEGRHDQQVLRVPRHGDFQRSGGPSLRRQRSVLPAIPPSAARRDRVGVVDAGGENVPRVLPKTLRKVPGSRGAGPRGGRIRSNCRV